TCSTSTGTYKHLPTVTGPTSGTALTPSVTGTALSVVGVTVKIYTDSGCTTTQVGGGSGGVAQATYQTTGIPVSSVTLVNTPFSATEKDNNGQTSPCSVLATYFHLPAVTGTSPSGSGTTTSLNVSGSALSAANVTLYSNSGCTNTVTGGTGTGASFAT